MAAPRAGNSTVRIWPYAGNPEYPALLAGDPPAVTMRRVRTISRKGPFDLNGNPQRPYARCPQSLRVMRWSHLHGDMQGVTSKRSVIPFRDVHRGHVRIRR